MADELDRVAAALSDRTRRELIERLVSSPGMTSGELSQRFRSISRWAVLKHLAVLRTAGLVETLAEGRRRRHYPNVAAARGLDEWLDRVTRRPPG